MEICGRATASADRQLVELDEWSHYNLYYNPEPVSIAMERIGPFVGQALKRIELEAAAA